MLRTPFLSLLVLAACLLGSVVQAQQFEPPQFKQCECENFVPTGRPVCATYNINFFDEAAVQCFNDCNRTDLKVKHYGPCVGPVNAPRRPQQKRK